VNYLLDCGANVHTDAGVFGKDCDLPIRFSIFNSDYKMFKILLDYGANVLKCFNKDEIQLLHLDSMSSIKAIVKENSKIYSEIKKIIDKYYAKRKNYKRYKKIR
jgi:ankyrin repeat protein